MCIEPCAISTQFIKHWSIQLSIIWNSWHVSNKHQDLINGWCKFQSIRPTFIHRNSNRQILVFLIHLLWLFVYLYVCHFANLINCWKKTSRIDIKKKFKPKKPHCRNSSKKTPQNRWNRQNRDPLTHKYMTSQLPGLVPALQ
jgi:hypothetical protein